MNNNSSIKMGIICFKAKSNCKVLMDKREILCKISKNVKIIGEEQRKGYPQELNARTLENQLVVGDRVVVSLFNTEAIITERLPRSNHIARRSTTSRVGGYLIEQVLASNVDQVIVVFAAANPEPKWNLLDRYLVMAEALELPVKVIITKIDLVKNQQSINELKQALKTYQEIGYPVIMTSCTQKLGINDLSEQIKDKTSVMIGKSGVGKTSLLNSLIPDQKFRVQDVNEITGKGRHTTTSMYLIPIDSQTMLIDSPGTREFGLWDVDPDEIDWFFPEMRPFIGNCKFKLDCRHEEEPGCAIRKAVVNHYIDPRRYQSYLKLKEEFLL